MKLNTQSLAEVTLGTPIIAAGTYYARIKSAEVKPNKSGDGNNLDLVLALHGDTVDLHVGGSVPNHGFVLFRTISLKATEKYNPNKNLKELGIAIGNEPDADLELEMLAGKDLKAVVKYQAAEGNYGEKNDVSGFRPIKDDEGFTPSTFVA
jgi:hypothetical protein